MPLCFAYAKEQVLRQHTYAIYCDYYDCRNDNFQMKTLVFSSYLCSKQNLWVLVSRLPEFRNFPVRDRFRNRQTVLFYEKHIFIGPKMTLFIFLIELNFVRPLSFEIFSCLVRKFTSFDQIPSGVKLLIVSN